MLDLLHERDKKTLYREYIFRLIAVTLVFCAATIGIAITLLLPSLVLSRIKEQSASERAAALSTDANVETSREASAFLNRVAREIKLLSIKSTSSPSVLIANILADKPDGVRVTGLDIQMNGSKEVAVTGVSPDRERLVEFSRRLKKESFVSAVDLPISSLAKENNIPFTLQITVQ